MNTTRANPFSDIETLPTFAPKAKALRPAAGQIEKIAEANGFPSRQAAKTPPRASARRRYKTGRNQQINIKATAEVIERLYKMADTRRVPLGELLEQALNALQKTSEL
jgi:RNA polymerase-interacting CarD/CdnL/TRCF family regulator